MVDSPNGSRPQALSQEDQEAQRRRDDDWYEQNVRAPQRQFYIDQERDRRLRAFGLIEEDLKMLRLRLVSDQADARQRHRGDTQAAVHNNNGGDAGNENPPPLPFINMSRWDHEPVPDRDWAVQDRIPLRQTCLFSGEGAAGKGIVQLHQCTAHVLARDWLGTLPQPGPAIFIECEDEERELHIRLAAILDHYGAKFSDAITGGLHLMSLAGKDAVLAAPTRNGKIEPTRLYQQVLEAAGDIKPKMIGIASSANVYAGNENDRPQVQQFINLLTRIAIVADGAVTLISHPSLSGINSDSGLSGVTQWHNAVRARYYLKSVQPETGEQPDSDLREIVFKKNQYGPISANIILRYQRGLFLPVSGASSLDKIARDAKGEEIFLDLLKRFSREGRNVSEKRNAPNYAPTTFARLDEAKKFQLRKTDFEAAMEQLFKANKIYVKEYGRTSRPNSRLAVKE